MPKTALLALLAVLICTAFLGIGLLIGAYRERRKRQRAAIRGVITGWGASLRTGDKLLLEHQNGNKALYVVVAVSYQRDVADIWRAEVEFKAEMNRESSIN